LMHWILRGFISFFIMYLLMIVFLVPLLIFINLHEWRWVSWNDVFHFSKFTMLIAFLWSFGNWFLNKFIKMPDIKPKKNKK